MAAADSRRAAADDPVIRQLADEGIYLGVTAWAQLALAECGAFYPPAAGTAEERLHHYASRYPITEVDSAFYYPLSERTTALWAERTPPGFVFDVKAFRLLTQHPTPPNALWPDLPNALWPDLREALPADQAAKPQIYVRNLPDELAAEAFRRFTAALEPLRRAGRLGVVLFQFPRYVYPSRVSSEYLERVARQLPGLGVAVEFRQPRWVDQEHRGGTLDFLSRHRLAFVCVDEPRGFPDTLPPVAAATADVAEVRFHGRNAESWAMRDATPRRRYAYNYRADELAEWVPKISALHGGGRPVHVLLNNCWRGFAVRNAHTLAQLLVQELG
jgi:uncharacterized protein YecE (DUF72 family)